MLKMLVITILAVIGAATSYDEVNNYVHLYQKASEEAFQKPYLENAYQHIPKTENPEDYGVFDHVIIGAGSAGAVIASRLSEDGNRTVLLLEAGEHATNLTNIPAAETLITGLENNWGYKTVPQTTSCLGMKDQQGPIHRGKGIGGSSMINALLYVRGNRRDYDNWYAQGNLGWSYEDVLPYFKKSENFPDGDPKFRGSSGYLNVVKWEETNPQSEAFLEAHRVLGMSEVDYNGGEQMGYARLQLNIRNGQRQSSGNAFLLPVMHRKNLEVLTGSYVIKILTNKDKEAFGVLFTRHGKLFIAKSRRDLVLSAGAIGSPQLLMLSGIGPKSHLESLGIPVIKDLPVGEHLEDHPCFPFMDFTTNYTHPKITVEEQIAKYLGGHGELTNPLNLQVVSFIKTKYETIPDYPDIEIFMAPSINSNHITHKFWHLSDELAHTILKGYDPQSTITIIGMLFHPKSVGNLRLKSANPYDYPLIDPKMLSDPNGEDIEIMYEAIQFMLKLIETPPFQKLNTKLRYAPPPACKSLQYLSREYWHCFLRQMVLGTYHVVGTCKMGPHPSQGAVVDPELKVFGIKNLRVADTSVIPSSTSGHTNAPAMMIGEKAADLIRGYTTF